MRGAKAAARVAVEVLVEKKVVAKMRVALEALVVTGDWAHAIRVAQKQPRQAAAQLVCYLVDGDVAARSGRTFDLKVVSVVVMKLLQGLDDEEIHGKPDGAAPVRVAAEEPRFRF